MDLEQCPDCGRTIEAGYKYAVHRAFKHDDWTLLDRYYEQKGKEPWYAK